MESVALDADAARDMYFEAIIENVDPAGTLEIGFCEVGRLETQKEINRQGVSINASGEVKVANRTVNRIKNLGYGDIVGMGIRSSDCRVWITFNGEFLNPVPPSEAEDWHKSKMENKEDRKNEA